MEQKKQRFNRKERVLLFIAALGIVVVALYGIIFSEKISNEVREELRQEMIKKEMQKNPFGFVKTI